MLYYEGCNAMVNTMANEKNRTVTEACLRLERAIRLSEALIALDGSDKDDVEQLLREALDLLRGIDAPVM